MSRLLKHAVIAASGLTAAFVAMSVEENSNQQERLIRQLSDVGIRNVRAREDYKGFTVSGSIADEIMAPRKSATTTYRRRKNLRKVSAKGHHNHDAFLKRERNRRKRCALTI